MMIIKFTYDIVNTKHIELRSKKCKGKNLPMGSEAKFDISANLENIDIFNPLPPQSPFGFS